VGVISPYVRRLRLANELRAVRASRGLTHEQLAKKIGQSRAQISRLENGHVVDLADIIKILDVLGVDGERWTQIVTIAREAAERGWWESTKGMGERQALYANLEAGAATIREFQMTFVPGLLQTPEYTAARVEAEGHSGATAFAADEVIAARAGRQRMLRRPNGPSYDVILDEMAVRRAAAPSEVVRAQLYHVAARVNGDPRTTVRVLPLDAEIEGFSVPRSAFSLYTYPDDTVTDDIVLTDGADVKRYEELYDRLRDAAMSVSETLRFLVEMATVRTPFE